MVDGIPVRVIAHNEGRVVECAIALLPMRVCLRKKRQTVIVAIRLPAVSIIEKFQRGALEPRRSKLRLMSVSDDCRRKI